MLAARLPHSRGHQGVSGPKCRSPRWAAFLGAREAGHRGWQLEPSMESAFRELTDEASTGHWKDNMGLLGPTWWALKNYIEQPWLVWLSESSAGCQSMGLQFDS